MHGILAFGRDYQLVDSETGRLVQALEFIARRGAITRGGRQVHLLAETRGFPHFLYDEAAQAHENQFLMILAAAKTPLSYRFTTSAGRLVEIGDLLRQATLVFQRDQHPAWTSVAFIHYLGPRGRWQNALGEAYSIADLVGILLGYDDRIEGGTHRLYGLAYALRHMPAAPASTAQPWSEVRTALSEAVRAAQRWRRPDGAFRGAWWGASANVPAEAEVVGDVMLKTGHMLEWLTLACSRLACPAGWLDDVAAALARRMFAADLAGSEPQFLGAVFHAAHGLRQWLEFREQPSRGR